MPQSLSQTPLRIVIIGGVPESLESFRGPLISRLVSLGHEVIAMAGHENPSVTRALRRRGARFELYPLNRTQTNPLNDLRTFAALWRHFRRLEPDLVLGYTIKPVVWGGLAARCAGVRHFHALVTGLGGQLARETRRQRLVALVIGLLYRAALSGADTVIFQNEDDRETLIGKGFVGRHKTHRVHGSGVDLNRYRRRPMPNGNPVFISISRLMAAKGLREYAAAARVVRQRHPHVQFRLIGMVEHGAGGISENEIREWQEDGVLQYGGGVADVRDVLAEAHVFVLASYYGEGVPRTILEAMATGRPVLTTDNVGCRDAVDDGVNGRIVEPRDVAALVQGMEWFLGARDAWGRLADQGRRLAEEKYDVRKVNDHLIAIMGLQGVPAPLPQRLSEPEPVT